MPRNFSRAARARRLAPVVLAPAVLAALTLAPGAAMAQQQPAPPTSADAPAGEERVSATSPEAAFDGAAARKWTISVEPIAWYASPSGKIRLPASGGGGGGGGTQSEPKLSVLNVDSPRLSPAGAVRFRLGRWGGAVQGFAFGIDERDATLTSGLVLGDLNLSAGESVRTSLDIWSAEAKATYALVDEARGTLSDGRDRVRVRLDAVGGVRAYGVDAEVTRLGASTGANSTSAEETWVYPFAGARVDLLLAERWGIATEVTYGGWAGGNSASGLDIQAAFTWQPLSNLGVTVGYRALFSDLREGSGNERFRVDGGLQGLFAGVVVRF